MSAHVRRWDECSGEPCICPKPAKPLAVNFGAVAEVAIGQERARWLEWLVAIGYGVDFTNNPPPPCEIRELAEVYADTDGESVDDWEAILLDGNTAGGWYGDGRTE